MQLSKFFFVLLSFLVFQKCYGSSEDTTRNIVVYTDFDSFQKDWLTSHTEETVVVNFWATWCKPCVKELPYFEALNTKYQGQNFKLILISMDRPQDKDTRVTRFLDKNGYKSEVAILAAPTPNDWIDKIDPTFSGAIPATVVYNKNQKSFYEKEFESLQELEETVFKHH
jgi:thiol-disulfide isomerase/thioredoxin